MAERRRSPRRLCPALLVAALALLAPATASAAAGWLPAQDLSTPIRQAANADVAMDGSGNAVVVWDRQGEGANRVLEAAVRDAGGGYEITQLSANGNSPQVEMTPSGLAVVAWVNFAGGQNQIRVATRPPGADFQSPEDVVTLPSGSSKTFDLAINDSGDAAVTWLHGGEVFVSTRSNGGSFGDPVAVSQAGNPQSPKIAVDAAGTATVVWRAVFDFPEPDPDRSEVQFSTGAGTNFSMPAAISSTADEDLSDLPQVVVDGDGETVVVWRASHGGSDEVIEWSARQPGGSFSPPIPSDPTVRSTNPQVAVDETGNELVLWEESESGAAVVVGSARLGGAFGEPFDVSEPVLAVFFGPLRPTVAVNAGGAAIASWQRDGIVQAAIGSVTEGFGPPADLSAPGQEALFPEPAIDGTGNAIAVWRRSNGLNDVVQAAGYDAAGPEIRGLSIPPSAGVGEPVVFSATPFDVWGIASTVFDFGDGTGAAGTSVTHAYGSAGTRQVTVTTTDALGNAATAAGAITVRASNRFRILKPRRSRRRGIVWLRVRVFAPGRVVVRGRKVKRRTRRTRFPRVVTIPVIARGKARKRLLRKGRVRVRFNVFFSPDGGATARKSRAIVLIKKGRRGKARRPATRHRRAHG